VRLNGVPVQDAGSYEVWDGVGHVQLSIIMEGRGVGVSGESGAWACVCI